MIFWQILHLPLYLRKNIAFFLLFFFNKFLPLYTAKIPVFPAIFCRNLIFCDLLPKLVFSHDLLQGCYFLPAIFKWYSYFSMILCSNLFFSAILWENLCFHCYLWTKFSFFFFFCDSSTEFGFSPPFFDKIFIFLRSLDEICIFPATLWRNWHFFCNLLT